MSKSGIGPARHLDLARQRFDAFVVGAQAEVNFRQRRRGRTAVARLAPAKIRSRAAEGPAALAFWPGRAAARSGRTATVAARAIVIPSRPGRAHRDEAGGGHGDRGRRGGRIVRFRPRSGRTWRRKALSPRRAERVRSDRNHYQVVCSLLNNRRILRCALQMPLRQHGTAAGRMQASAGIIPQACLLRDSGVKLHRHRQRAEGRCEECNGLTLSSVHIWRGGHSRCFPWKGE